MRQPQQEQPDVLDHKRESRGDSLALQGLVQRWTAAVEEKARKYSIVCFVSQGFQFKRPGYYGGGKPPPERSMAVSRWGKRRVRV